MCFLNFHRSSFTLGTHVLEGTWWHSTGYTHAWILLKGSMSRSWAFIGFLFERWPFLSFLDSVPSFSLQSQVSSCPSVIFLGFLGTLPYNAILKGTKQMNNSQRYPSWGSVTERAVSLICFIRRPGFAN